MKKTQSWQKIWLILWGLGCLLLCTNPAFAQTEGGGCISPHNTLGASVITNSGNVYNQWQCDNSTLYRARRTWDISNQRSLVNWGEKGTCDVYATGRLSYDSGTSAYVYCDGTIWKVI